jgi:hypothetical protein
VLALLVIVVALFRDTLLLGGGFYKRDIHLCWLPQVEAFVRAVAAGSWPVWDPSPAFGRPLLAGPRSQVLYPLTWLSLVMTPRVYYTWFAASHCFFSALCLFLLARRWGLTRLASLTAGVLWLVSGPYMSFVDLWHHFAGASWMPAVVLAFDRAAEQRRLPSFLAAGLVLSGQVLAGSPDMIVVTLAIVAADVLLVFFTSRTGGDQIDPTRPPRPHLGGLALALVLAAALTASLWLPAADAASRSSRADLPASDRAYWSVHPLGLLDTLLPGVFNIPRLSHGLSATLFEGRQPFLDTLYLGLPALALVALGAGFAHRRRALLLLCLVAATVIALGRHTFVYEAIVTLVPPLRMLRYPVKVTIALAFAWSLLAGLGCNRLADRGSPERRSARIPFVLVGLGAAASCAGTIAILFAPDAVGRLVLDAAGPASARELLSPLAGRLALSAAAGVALIVAYRATAGAGARALACALVAMAELAVQHRDPNPVAPGEFFSYRPEVLRLLAPPSAARVFVYDYLNPGESERLLGRPWTYRTREAPEGWTRDALLALSAQAALVPESAGRWGVRQAYSQDYEGLYPKLIVEMGRVVRDVDGTPVHTRWLQLGGVTNVVALHRRGLEHLRPVGTVLTPDPVYVFDVPGTLPRVYAVSGVRVAQGTDSFRILSDPRFDPRSEVVLAPGEARVQGPGRPGSARIVSERPDRLVMEARMDEPGYLVVLDTHDPGWRVAVDGRADRLLLANAGFRAVRLPAGRHVVEMVYRPRALLVGLWVSGATAAGMVGALLSTRPRRRLRGGGQGVRTAPGTTA